MEIISQLQASAALAPEKEAPVPIAWVSPNADLSAAVAKRKYPCPFRKSDPSRPATTVRSELIVLLVRS